MPERVLVPAFFMLSHVPCAVCRYSKLFPLCIYERIFMLCMYVNRISAIIVIVKANVLKPHARGFDSVDYAWCGNAQA